MNFESKSKSWFLFFSFFSFLWRTKDISMFLFIFCKLLYAIYIQIEVQTVTTLNGLYELALNLFRFHFWENSLILLLIKIHFVPRLRIKPLDCVIWRHTQTVNGWKSSLLSSKRIYDEYAIQLWKLCSKVKNSDWNAFNRSEFNGIYFWWVVTINGIISKSHEPWAKSDLIIFRWNERKKVLKKFKALKMGQKKEQKV